MQNGSCPCGSEKNLSTCCGPLLDGQVEAETPEALMRSRFTAFAVKNVDYIFDTTDPQARYDFDIKANKDWAENSQFLKLEVLSSSFEGNKGTVEFKAHYKIGDQPVTIHHEIAKFRKQAGIWYFRDGKVIPQPEGKE